jgi:predicted metal-dependent hydrolase
MLISNPTEKKGLEYIIIHELCHLIEPNYSNELYKL